MVVSLKAKATAITSCVIIVVFLVVSIAYYKGLEKYAVERAYSQAIPIMEVGQMMIDGDAFQKVMQSNNRENEEYKEIKKTLDILGHLTEEGQIFTAGIKEGQLVYLGDDIKDYKVLKNLEANDEGIEAVTNNIMQTLKRGEPYYFNKGHKGYRKG